MTCINIEIFNLAISFQYDIRISTSVNCYTSHSLPHIFIRFDIRNDTINVSTATIYIKRTTSYIVNFCVFFHIYMSSLNPYCTSRTVATCITFNSISNSIVADFRTAFHGQCRSARYTDSRHTPEVFQNSTFAENNFSSIITISIACYNGILNILDVIFYFTFRNISANRLCKNFPFMFTSIIQEDIFQSQCYTFSLWCCHFNHRRIICTSCIILNCFKILSTSDCITIPIDGNVFMNFCLVGNTCTFCCINIIQQFNSNVCFLTFVCLSNRSCQGIIIAVFTNS